MPLPHFRDRNSGQAGEGLVPAQHSAGAENTQGAEPASSAHTHVKSDPQSSSSLAWGPREEGWKRPLQEPRAEPGVEPSCTEGVGLPAFVLPDF